MTDIFDKHTEEVEEHSHYVNYDPDLNHHEDDSLEEAHCYLDLRQVPRLTSDQTRMSLKSRIQWLIGKRHQDM